MLFCVVKTSGVVILSNADIVPQYRKYQFTDVLFFIVVTWTLVVCLIYAPFCPQACDPWATGYCCITIIGRFERTKNPVVVLVLALRLLALGSVT